MISLRRKPSRKPYKLPGKRPCTVEKASQYCHNLTIFSGQNLVLAEEINYFSRQSSPSMAKYYLDTGSD